MSPVTFEALLNSPGVVERVELRNRFGFMAIHGGLEAHTDAIAAKAACRAGASLYAVVQPADMRWHIPSHRVVPGGSDRLAIFLEHVDTVISLHGYGRPDRRRQVLVGGRNRDLARIVAAHLARHLEGFIIIDDVRGMPAEMRGLHASNPVNAPRRGGVQIELPPSVRTEPGLVTALAKAAVSWLSPRRRDQPPGHTGRDPSALRSAPGPGGVL